MKNINGGNSRSSPSVIFHTEPLSIVNRYDEDQKAVPEARYARRVSFNRSVEYDGSEGTISDDELYDDTDV